MREQEDMVLAMSIMKKLGRLTTREPQLQDLEWQEQEQLAGELRRELLKAGGDGQLTNLKMLKRS